MKNQSKSASQHQQQRHQPTTATNNPLWQQPFHTPYEASAKGFGTPPTPPTNIPSYIELNEAHATISHQHSLNFTPRALPKPSFRCEVCGETWPLNFMRMIPNPTSFFKPDIMACKVCVKEMEM